MAAAFPAGLAAQGAGSSLGIAGGLLRHGQSDAAASPVQYRGTIPGLVIEYVRTGAGGRFESSASFATGALESRLSDGGYPAEEAHMVRAGVRWLWPVARFARPSVTLLAGAQLDGHAAVRIHRYHRNSSEVFADLLAPLQAAAGWDWSDGRSRVGQRLALPVAGLVMRTPWGGLKSIPPVEAAWPGEILGLDHELYAERAFSPRAAIRGAWAATLLRHAEPRDLRVATHRAVVGFVLQWGKGS